MNESEIRRISQRQAPATSQHPQQLIDLSATSPDLLADSIREALSRIPLEERQAVQDRLLYALDEARVNLRQVLFALGIPTTTSDELTPPEIGKVIRFVRINDAKAMEALLPVVNDLLSAQAEPDKSSKISSRAA